MLFNVQDLPGIKPRQVKLLQEQGIMTAQALAMLAPDALAGVEGMSANSAKQLIWQARQSLNLTAFTPAADIKEDYQHITTLSVELNRILGGGISTGRITEVFGAFKSGKTCLSHTAAVSVQLPPEKGGLGKACAFIDTENTFAKEKIVRIAKRVGMDPAEALSRIFHVKVFSSDHQSQMVRNAESIIASHNVGLIIVDSLMALFRAEYVGIGALARRQQALNNLIHDLGRVAEVYIVAILVTNQVATRMLGAGFAQDDAIGGNIVAHGCHFRMQFQAKGFQKNQSLERKATIVDAPDLPPEDCSFFITEAGIADSEEVTYAGPVEGESSAEDPPKKGVKKKAPKRLPEPDAPEIGDAALFSPVFSFLLTKSSNFQWYIKFHMVGRNDPCPCGSGKKYKNCHLIQDRQTKSFIPAKVLKQSEWAVIAIARRDSGDLEGAKNAFEKAIEENPNDYTSWNDLGNLYFMQKQYEDGISALKKAIELNPNYYLAHYNCGIIYEAMGHIDDAIHEYNLAVQRNPQYKFAWNNLGNCYLEKQNFEGAINCFTKSLKIDSKYFNTWINLAHTYFKNQDYQNADKCYVKGIAIQPDNIDSLSDLGLCRLKSGNFHKAVKVLEIARDIAKKYEIENKFVWIRLGNAQLSLGNYEEAAKSYLKWIEIDESNPFAYLSYGYVMAALNQTESTSHYYEIALEKYYVSPTPIIDGVLACQLLLQYLNYNGSRDIEEYSPIFEKILKDAIKLYETLPPVEDNLWGEISPFLISLRWYGWRIGRATKEFAEHKVGEIPHNKISQLFKNLFGNMTKYHNTNPIDYPIWKTFWECVQFLIPPSEENVANWASNLAQLEEKIDFVFNESKAVSDEILSLFYAMKDFIQRTKGSLISAQKSTPDYNLYKDICLQIEHMIENFFKMELPLPPLTAIMRNSLQYSKNLYSMRQKILEVKSMATSDITGLSDYYTPMQLHLQELVDKIENLLKETIELLMTDNYGPNWMEHCLEKETRDNIRKRWSNRNKKNPNHRLIDELTFNQYEEILGGARKPFFEKYFDPHYPTITRDFPKMREIRNNVAHGNWHLIHLDEDRKFSKEFLELFAKK